MSNHLDPGLAGYWKLKGNCRDYSGRGNHGVNVDAGNFNGRDSYIEVPDSPSLGFGSGDFSISVWVYTERDIDDVIGDVLSKYDPEKRKGFNLSVKASSGGYSSHGDDRHVYFCIDDARLSDWQDCGRPTEKSNYVSNSLTVFDGHLYAGTTDAHEKADWCHVYRYEGGQNWSDCGRNYGPANETRISTNCGAARSAMADVPSAEEMSRVMRTWAQATAQAMKNGRLGKVARRKSYKDWQL